MEDRFTRGFTAGFLTGILQNIFSYYAGTTGLTELTMGDWAGIIIYSHTPPFSTGEYIFAVFAQLIFTGVLGILFAYLALLVTSKNLILKGLVFSATIWFFIYGFSALFQLKGTAPLSLNTALSNLVVGTIYGIFLPIILKALTPQEDNARESRAILAPALKPATGQSNDQGLTNKSSSRDEAEADKSKS